MPKPKLKKMGNPNNQTVDGFRGVSAETLRAKRLAKKTPAGESDRIVSYEPEAVRAAIEAQVCPFCGAGPYRMVATHTGIVHGVNAAELRVLAGLTRRAPICSPEHSRIRRTILLDRGSEWLENFREKGNAASVAVDSIAAANASLARHRQLETADRDLLVLRLYRDGDLLKDIAAKAGIGDSTVKAILVRNDITVDTRSRRPHVPSQRETWGLKSQKVTRAQRAEIVELYGTGLTQAEIGQRYGITQTRVGQILRQVREIARIELASPAEQAEGRSDA